MTMEGGAGVVPVMDLNRNNYGDGFGYGGGAWFMWIIVLFALMGGWGNNRNNGLESALTRSDLANGFDAQDIKNGIRGVQNGLCDGFPTGGNVPLFSTGRVAGLATGRWVLCSEHDYA